MMPIAQEPARLEKEIPLQRAGSILIVDDQPMIRDLMVEILTDEGYVVHSAPNDTDVLATIACDQPALLLVDLGKPGTSGAGLIGQLRSAGLATLPMVVMTTAPATAAGLLIPGSIECLAKPFDLDELLACVARYMPPAGSRSTGGIPR
jgi:two-component system KDP operon response regulator KdpE